MLNPLIQLGLLVTYFKNVKYVNYVNFKNYIVFRVILHTFMINKYVKKTM